MFKYVERDPRRPQILALSLLFSDNNWNENDIQYAIFVATQNNSGRIRLRCTIWSDSKCMSTYGGRFSLFDSTLHP